MNKKWWRTGFIDSDDNSIHPFPNNLQEDWHLEWDRATRMPETFLKECISVATHIGNTYDNIKILFSGGKDSEAVVRSFQLAKIPFICLIFSFDENLNDYDIKYAIDYCKNQNLDYEIINVPFYDYYVYKPELHTHYLQFDRTDEYPCWMWAVSELDGTLICGNGMKLDFMYKTKSGLDTIEKFSAGNRAAHYDYIYKGEYVDDLQEEYQETPWFLTFCELDGDTWDNYNYAHNKDAVTKFFAYTPEIVLSQLLDPLVINAMKNPEYGHNTLTPLKNDFYLQYFPDMIPRPKYSGNEKLSKSPQLKEYQNRTAGEMLWRKQIKSYRYYYDEFVNSILPINEKNKKNDLV